MAAGHTAGSRFVYVKLDGGTEILLVGDVVWMSFALGQNRTFPAAISRHGFFGSGPNFERLGLGDLLGGIDERHPHNLRGGLPVRRFHVDIVAEFSQLDRQPRVPNILLQPG